MAETTGQKWWSKDTVAVVTGGNRGIGHEIARQLASQGFIVVLADIVSEEELKKSAAELAEKLGSTLPSPRVHCHHVDIRSDESVQQLATWLKETFGHISILVNNAGIGIPSEDFKYAEDTLETNFWGTKRVTEALLPLLSSPEGGRIVFITSRLGAYTRLKDGYGKRKLSDVQHLTEGDLEDVGRRYLNDIKADRVEQEGWLHVQCLFAPAYSESKMLVSAYTLLLAKSLQSDSTTRSISVNAVCPGPTHTAIMYKAVVDHLDKIGWPVKSIPEGADTPVWLILLPKDGYPHGKFFAERQEYPYDLELPGF